MAVEVEYPDPPVCRGVFGAMDCPHPPRFEIEGGGYVDYLCLGGDDCLLIFLDEWVRGDGEVTVKRLPVRLSSDPQADGVGRSEPDD